MFVGFDDKIELINWNRADNGHEFRKNEQKSLSLKIEHEFSPERGLKDFAVGFSKEPNDPEVGDDSWKLITD